MESSEELLDHFNSLNINPSSEVIDRCISLCHTYKIEPEELVEQWVAFCLSNKLDTEPSLEKLSSLERKEFHNYSSASGKSSIKNATPKSNFQSVICDTPFDNTPKANANHKRISSPDADSAKKRFGTGRNLTNMFCTSSLSSPDVFETSTKYSERTDSGKILCSFGGNLLEKATWKSIPGQNIIKVRQWDEVKQMPVDVKYMHVSEPNQVSVEVHHAREVLSTICKKKNIDSENLALTPGFIGGRICSAAMSRLDQFSVQVEDVCNVKSSNIGTIELNLKLVNKYSFFPGQAVVLKYVNSDANKISVREVYANGNEQFSEKFPYIQKGPLQIMISAGPFTQPDNLLYQPLEDVINYIISNKPDVAIFIGPFVDIEHETVKTGKLEETFLEMFDRIFTRLMQSLQSLHTEIVVVSSSRDAHHHSVFPTMPYSIEKMYSNLHLIPDPGFLDINGLIIGLTSVDILRHLGQEEICIPMQSDRLGRLASHLITQQNMYPLMPANEEICLDHLLWQTYARFKTTPHILILPSKLQYFIKNVEGCVVVNPGYAAKGQKGGTFCRMEVYPDQKKSSIADVTACEILKV